MYCQNCGTPISPEMVFCPSCGNAVPMPNTPVPPYFHDQSTTVLQDEQTFETGRKSKKWLILSISVIAILIVAAVVLLFVFRTPQFKMEPDGSLYYDGSIAGEPIEIPMDFDGKANSFSNIDDIGSNRFVYRGSLSRFVKYHNWIFYENYPERSNAYTVTCKDYKLEFWVNGTTGGSTFYYPPEGSIEIISIKYSVYELDGDSVENFEYLSDLRVWLD